MTSHPCLPAPIRPNTIPSFQLVDASRQRLKDSPSPLVPSAWATLLQEYPGPLRVHLPMILRFGVQIGYEGPTDILRIEKNLTSANEDPETIENKLQEDLRKGRVRRIAAPSQPFVASPLGLVPKHDGGWRRIHHLSHPNQTSVNDNIPEEASKLQYARLDDIIQLILSAGKGAVIVKRDVKDAFRNVPVAPHHQWLLGFGWNDEFYTETCLSFGLSTAPFIFNLFAEGFHWILVSFLQWRLHHYLDDFVAIFPSETSSERLHQETKAYNILTDILGIPRNDSKDAEGTTATVFGLEVDTINSLIRLPADKLEKARIITTKALNETTISLGDMQSIAGFLSFCAQAVKLGRVFLRLFWNFIASFPSGSHRRVKRRIPTWVRQDLIWWNKLLVDFNGIVFFETSTRDTIKVHTDACLTGLGGYFQQDNELVNQKNACRARVLVLNQEGSPCINVREVEAILLILQKWAPTWRHRQILVFTDSNTAYTGFTNLTLKGPANAPLREILSIAAKWDIVLRCQWISGTSNGLADALSRFDDERLANFCPHWQNPYNSMNLPPPTYPPHQGQPW